MSETDAQPVTRKQIQFWGSWLRQSIKATRYTLSVSDFRHMNALVSLQYLFEFTDDEAGIDDLCFDGIAFALDHFEDQREWWSFDRQHAEYMQMKLQRLAELIDAYLASEQPDKGGL